MHRTRYGKLREILTRGEALVRRSAERAQALMQYCTPGARRERVAREEAAQRLAQDIVCILRAIRRQRERLHGGREASGRTIGPS
jgi:hypothetical protein